MNFTHGPGIQSTPINLYLKYASKISSSPYTTFIWGMYKSAKFQQIKWEVLSRKEKLTDEADTITRYSASPAYKYKWLDFQL